MKEFTFESTAKKRGTLLSFKELKKGKFIEASTSEKATLMTTMLTDIPESLWKFCKKMSPEVQRKVIKPNGFTSATFIFEYKSNEFEIEITRKLKNRWMLILFNFYAELPESYKIIIKVKAKSNEKLNKIKKFLQSITKDRGSIIN